MDRPTLLNGVVMRQAEQFSGVTLVDRAGRAEQMRLRLGAGLSHESNLTKTASSSNSWIISSHNLANRQFGQTAWQTFRSNQQERVIVTGSRSIRKFELEDQLAEKLYNEIRNSRDDVQKIAKNLSMPKFQVRRIKEHVFYNTHQLDHGLGIGRFHPDLEIATAWQRLEAGTHVESDLLILRHEHFESRFEGIFRTDYRTAHDAANRAGRPSGLKDTDFREVKNGITD